MHTNPPSRQSLLRYLLNELDETEREQIDTLLITDAEYEAKFQEGEYDLLDALAAGELTEGDEARTILALKPGNRFSPERHRRRSVAPVVLEPSRIGTSLTTTRRDHIVRPWFRDVRLLGLAALLLVGIALGLWASRPAASRSGGNQSVVATATVVRPNPPLVEVVPGHPVGRQPVLPPVQAPKAEAAPVTAMLLLPGASRSSASLSLRIPHEAAAVQIDWPAPPDADQATRYRLQMVNDVGKVACTSAGSVRHGAEGTLIRFRCSARDVPAGTDFVRVSTLPADPDAPPLIEVAVSVEKP